ncbi:MAG: hypothetical protein CGEMS_0247 [Candidatus Campylobacter infans]|nr:MAG: hypothetical protein CGEMS_0247 [Candidatus Campylobacter infans]
MGSTCKKRVASGRICAWHFGGLACGRKNVWRKIWRGAFSLVCVIKKHASGRNKKTLDKALNQKCKLKICLFCHYLLIFSPY